MTPIFDTHAHYDDEAFDEDRDELLSTIFAGGIGKIVNIGASIASCKKGIELAAQYPQMYLALGVHPSDVKDLNEETAAWLENEVRSNAKCLAVGEIGLDYYWDTSEVDAQKEWFAWQLNLARRTRKPVVIHSRDACKDTIDLMTAEKAEEIGGVIHCYSYTKETARTFLNMGFYFGIGGVLTYKNAQKLKEAVEYIPLDRIVLETDCPYLSPVPNRGKRNSSLNIPHVIHAMAQIKGVSEEEIRRAAWENSHALYRISTD